MEFKMHRSSILLGCFSHTRFCQQVLYTAVNSGITGFLSHSECL